MPSGVSLDGWSGQHGRARWCRQRGGCQDGMNTWHMLIACKQSQFVSPDSKRNPDYLAIAEQLTTPCLKHFKLAKKSKTTDRSMGIRSLFGTSNHLCQTVNQLVRMRRMSRSKNPPFFGRQNKSIGLGCFKLANLTQFLVLLSYYVVLYLCFAWSLCHDSIVLVHPILIDLISSRVERATFESCGKADHDDDTESDEADSAESDNGVPCEQPCHNVMLQHLSLDLDFLFLVGLYVPMYFWCILMHVSWCILMYLSAWWQIEYRTPFWDLSISECCINIKSVYCSFLSSFNLPLCLYYSTVV